MEDKLSPPAVRVDVLPRKRLIESLTTATESRITVLTAPAGSGKSILLATWWHTGRAGHVGWLSLDDSDNQPVVFWSYLVEALRRGASKPGRQLLADLDVPASITEGFIDRFLATVGKLPGDVIIVLDDVHRLRNPELLTGLNRVLRHAPPHLHVVLSGRRPPDLPLSKFRVAGHLVDIRYQDLACTAAEAAELLPFLDADLDRASAELVHRRTEGWIAGLRLAALWWRSQPASQRDVSLFSGRTPVVASYFEDEILGAWDPSVRQFMLRTCLVDTVCGGLADSLTDQHDGARRLDELVRRHGWVTSADSDGEWFRYNPLLREYLRTRLSRELPREVRSLHRRAAHWYARNDLILPALNSGADAEDWVFVARLLQQTGRRLRSADPNEVNAVLARVPDRLVASDSALALVYADVKLSQGDLQAAEPYLKLAERSPQPAESDSLGDIVRRAELQLRQDVLRGHLTPSALRRATDLLKHAEDSPEPYVQAALAPLAFQIALGHMSNGNTLAAREAIGLAVRYERDHDSELRPQLESWQRFLDVLDGRLTSADRAPRAQPLDVLAQAVAACERDHLDSSLALLQPGALQEQDSAAFSTVCVAHLLRGWILSLRGELDGARAELGLARSADTASALTAHYADLIESAILLRRGDTKAARRILTSALAEAPMPDLALDGIALGRLCLAEHDPDSALEAVRHCLDGTAANLRLIDTVAALLVSAAAQRIRGRAGPAEDELVRALELAAPEGLVQVFLTSGRIIQSMLTVVIPPHGPYASSRALLLHHFERQASLHTSPHSGLAPALTPSEQHVLRYLPSHLTNEEIAANLFLSVNTVKSHLRTLYRKLSVSNRRTAISKARQLGLLD